MENYRTLIHQKSKHRAFIYFFLMVFIILIMVVVFLAIYFKNYRALIFLPLFAIFIIYWKWAFKEYLNNAYDVIIEKDNINVEGTKLEKKDIEMIRRLPNKRYIEILIYPNDKTKIRKIVIPEKVKFSELLSITPKSVFLEKLLSDFGK